MSPSAPFYTRVQRNIVFFLRTKVTHSISTPTFAVPNLLQNACKMFSQTILLPPVSDCCFFLFFLLLTPSGVDTLFSCFHVRNPRPTNTWWYYGRTEMEWVNFSFMIPRGSTARQKRESISLPHASITEQCTHTPVCGSIGAPGCGLTAGILQKVTSNLQALKGLLAWDNCEAWNMPAVCNCTSLHVRFCFLFLLYDFSFLFLLLLFYYFTFFHLFCKGINWCFVSYSFVSVKGPGRKLSLPTDLKTDLGTVGESQQYSLDFCFKSFGFYFSSHFSRSQAFVLL